MSFFKKGVTSKKTSNGESYGLKNQVLSHSEVLGQSIANIAPTGTPTVVVPLVFAAAGAGTWFAYLFALIGILFISVNINHFAKRSASPGSIYTYIASSLGPVWGIIVGWALFIAYIACASSVTTGFTNYVNVLIKDLFHLKNDLPPYVLVLIIFISVIGSWFVAYKDVKLSTRLMLALELISISFILIVVGVTLFHNGFNIDWSQLKLKDLTLSNLRLGLVFAIFSFTGFESATSLGSEAKNPLKSISRAVWQSALFVGVLFIISSYTEVLGFAGGETTLDKTDAPLQVLASKAGIGFLGILITIGAIISFFACVLASITAGSRILFLMSRHGVFHSSIGNAHKENETPHNSLTVSAILAFVPAAYLAWKGSGMFAIYGWVGTTATIGFISAYILVSIAAPVYLYQRKELKPWHIIVSIIGILFMVTALVGAVTPWPDAPNSYPIIAFIVLLVGGIIWGAFRFISSATLSGDIRKDLDAIRNRYEKEGSGI